MNTRIDGLTNKLQEEKRLRENTIDALTQSNASNLQDMSEQVSALNKKTSALIADIQKQLHDGLQHFDEKLTKTREDLNLAVQSNAKELSGAKTDRQELANLFSELSNRLQREGVVNDGK
jgi:predicted phage gp36 major capsid-like protein